MSGDNKGEEQVNHPAHYGGEDNPYEAIKVIEAWRLNFHLGNALKYISRWQKVDGVKDLRKAIWYLQRYIETLSKGAVVPKPANDTSIITLPTFRDPITKVFKDVLRRRMEQDKKHGGPSHDDNHTRGDWSSFIHKYALRLEGALMNRANYRDTLIDIAALAIDAAESFDRNESGTSE